MKYSFIKYINYYKKKLIINKYLKYQYYIYIN